MTPFDIVFILLLLGGLAVGFFQGTIKILVAIVAFYIGIILASLYFSMLGNFFRPRFNSTVEVSQIVAFAVILLVTFLVMLVAGLYTFRYAKVPSSLDFVDKIIGSLFGLVLGAFIIGMIATMLGYLFIARDTASGIDLPVVVAFQRAVRGSQLLPYFSGYVLPLIYRTVQPVLPEEASFIFLAQ